MPANASAIFAGWPELTVAPVSAMSIGSLGQFAYLGDGRSEQGSELPVRFQVVTVDAYPVNVGAAGPPWSLWRVDRASAAYR